MTAVQDCVVVAVGDVPTGVYPDRTTWAAGTTAAAMAVDAVPELRSRINSVLVSGVMWNGRESADMAYSRLPAELGLHGITNNEQIFGGGATGLAMLRHACALLQANLAEAVLCVYSDRVASGLPTQTAIDTFGTFGMPYVWEGRVGQYFNTIGGLMTSAYMHETSATEEQLAAVAVSTSAWASRNPKAMLRQELTIEKVMSSRYMADPVKSLELPRFGDGAGAYIVTSKDVARDVCDVAAHVDAIGSEWGHYAISFDPTFPRLAFGAAARAAYASAGVSPEEIDFVEIYDTYPAHSMIQLEELGFTRPGETAEFVASGATLPGGALPMTTNGGMLRKGHTGCGGGFDLVIETVRQLTGRAEDRQIEAGRGLVTGTGGSYMNADVGILSRWEAA